MEKEKIQQIALLLRGALNAESMVGLKMNVSKDKLDDVISILPSLTSPTVAQLYKSEWFAVESVISELTVREIIPRLLGRGAEGIIEYPINKMVGSEDMV